jgi:CII-binding regulator of phage lambda lysogenization HflD
MTEVSQAFWSAFAGEVQQLQGLVQQSPAQPDSIHSIKDAIPQLSQKLQVFLQEEMSDTGASLQWITEIHRLLRLLELDIQFMGAARQSDRLSQRWRMVEHRLEQLGGYAEHLLKHL